MLSELHKSTYDVLSIVRRLANTLDGVTRAEVHLLAYVGCLLSIYQRLPANEWGYTFIRSQWGAPFSADIENAIAKLASGAFIDSRTELLRLTHRGFAFIEFLDAGEEHRWRSPYLEGACASALAMPIGSIRSALREEPSLRRASVHHQPRPLLDSDHDDALYEQFGAVSQVVGSDVTDLMVPSVVWLSYLGRPRNIEAKDVGSAPEQGTIDYE